MRTPKSILGWHFTSGVVLAHGDGRKIVVGKTMRHKGEVVPCQSGLHLSTRVIDALTYAADATILWRVRGGGVIVPHGDPVDKHACSERTALWVIDAAPVLRRFARWCALPVLHLWTVPVPEVVLRYLRCGKEEDRAAAWATARAAAMAAGAAARAEAAGGEAAAAGAVRSTQNRVLTQMILSAHKGTLDYDKPLPVPKRKGGKR